MLKNEINLELTEIGKYGNSESLNKFLKVNSLTIYSNNMICYDYACEYGNLEILEFIIKKVKLKYINVKNPEIMHPNVASIIHSGIRYCLSKEINDNIIKTLNFLLFKTEVKQNYAGDYSKKLYSTIFKKDSVLLFNFIKESDIILKPSLEELNSLIDEHLFDKSGESSYILEAIFKCDKFQKLLKPNITKLLKRCIEYNQFNIFKRTFHDNFFNSSIKKESINYCLIKQALQYSDYRIFEYIIFEMKMSKIDLNNYILKIKETYSYLKSFGNDEKIDSLYEKFELNKKLKVELNRHKEEVNQPVIKRTKI